MKKTSKKQSRMLQEKNVNLQSISGELKRINVIGKQIIKIGHNHSLSKQKEFAMVEARKVMIGSKVIFGEVKRIRSMEATPEIIEILHAVSTDLKKERKKLEKTFQEVQNQ